MSITGEPRSSELDRDLETGVTVHGVEEVMANQHFRVPIAFASQCWFGVEVLTIPRGVSCPLQIRQTQRLLYCTFGRGTVTCEEQRLDVYPGELIRVRALVPHAIGATLDAPFRLLAVAALECCRT